MNFYLCIHNISIIRGENGEEEDEGIHVLSPIEY